MKRLMALLALFFALSAIPAPAQEHDKLVFAVVISRHGVRSISKAPPEYEWADWQPVAPSFVSARGYRLMTYEGQFYRLYFGSHGLAISCSQPNVFVYADKDQRTLATGQALIEGMCGTPQAIPMRHAADLSKASDDPLFDGTQWAAAGHRIDASASRKAVMAALPLEHDANFDPLQRLLDARCASVCERVASGSTTIVQKEGLAEMSGPVKTASTYAEDLFLEYAQCNPSAPTDLAAAMRLHVLAYDINARNAYNPLVRGGTLFAHIVGMLEAKAGRAHGGVSNPDLAHDDLAIFAGHDTQLGALGGILDAHWTPASGIAPDDMPPGGALIFELYRRAPNDYRVRMTFVNESMQQFAHYKLLDRGVTSVPVRFLGCAERDCAVPLAQLAQRSQQIARLGLVDEAWTADSSDPVALDPLVNPKWTQCKP